jgi:hypothetical protein
MVFENRPLQFEQVQLLEALKTKLATVNIEVVTVEVQPVEFDYKAITSIDFQNDINRFFRRYSDGNHVGDVESLVAYYRAREEHHPYGFDRLTDALEAIPGIEYDKNRLEQEMIYYIEKLDINEEKQRLTNHLNYFMETMENGHGQGKKLGFIAQEMGREINTTGSKSNLAEMQNIVVMMKDELEQIKEQVLNVM